MKLLVGKDPLLIMYKQNQILHVGRNILQYVKI